MIITFYWFWHTKDAFQQKHVRKALETKKIKFYDAQSLFFWICVISGNKIFYLSKLIDNYFFGKTHQKQKKRTRSSNRGPALALRQTLHNQDCEIEIQFPFLWFPSELRAFSNKCECRSNHLQLSVLNVFRISLCVCWQVLYSPE